MTKTSSLDSKFQLVNLKNSIKSRWFPVLVLIPLGIYLLYVLLENQILNLVINFFPKEHDKSVEFYRDFLSIIFTELLWLSGFFLLAWVLVVYAPLTKWFTQTELTLHARSKTILAVVFATSFVGSLYVANRVLTEFPNSSDEYAYLYQAQTLSGGRLWEFAHDNPKFFYTNHISHKDGIRVSRFPPGWPLLLSVAYVIGFDPAWVNPILGLLTLMLFYSFATRFYTWKVAFWASLSLALTSFFIFNSASYFSHTSCAFFTVGFVYGIYMYFANEKPVYALLAGLCIGMVLITRYFTAVLIFLPFFFYIIHRLRTRSVRAFAWIALGTLPCMLFLFWYNYSITGNPFLPVTMWAYADESLGFVRGHSVVKGVEHLIRWTGMFLYWCSPALIILYLIGLIQKVSSTADRWVRPEDYFYLLLTAGYFFYYQIGGNQYGPRFFFEALPFLILFVVNRMLQFRAKWAMALFVSGFVYAIVKFPFVAEREREIVQERQDLYQLVESSRIHNAVVFVSSYTSVIRPMPIGDLTRNDIYYQNDVLYAIDLGEENIELMNYYPDRKFFRYVRDADRVEGRLERVINASVLLPKARDN